MIIKSVNLECVVGPTSKLPVNSLPEVAFSGKSNVGKSSLINAIMNRKSYARTSQSPGKTQTINYYNINDQLYLVDLPGYGYAKTSKESQAKWGKLIDDYLYTSKVLKQVFLLVDIRHEPSANDIQMYEWVKSRGFDPVIIATKSDKLSKNQINKSIGIIRKTLELPEETKLFPFSALNKSGRDEIVEYIEEICDL